MSYFCSYFFTGKSEELKSKPRWKKKKVLVEFILFFFGKMLIKYLNFCTSFISQVQEVMSGIEGSDDVKENEVNKIVALDLLLF